MADELNVSISVSFSKAACPTISRSLTDAVTISGTHVGETVQDIGTSAENLVLPGDIATNGYVVFQNLSTENYLEIGKDATGFTSFAKLKPGEIAVFRLMTGITFQSRANTATCRLSMIAFED